MTDAALQGLSAIMQPWPLFLMLAGILCSSVFAALPGVGVLLLLTIALPFAITLDPIPCIALLLGMGAVSNTANTFPSVLIAVPGSAGSQATIVDGYPMAQKGEAKRAFGAAFTASAMGGILGAIVLYLSLPILTPLVLSFGSPEFLLLVVWGLSAVGVLSGKAPIKGLLAAVVGVLIATVGVDDKTAIERFDFGSTYLWDGVSIVLVGLGLFAVPEMIALAVRRSAVSTGEALGGGLLDGIKDAFRHWWLVVRCSIIGVWVGVLPGLGSTVADWFAYAHAVQTEKNPENFGKGDVRGVIAPEASNNAKEGGALIPTIAFGIPGSTSLAIMLSAFLAVGIAPGSDMLTTNLNYTFAMIWVLVIANLIATTLSIGASPMFAKVSLLPFYMIVPLTLVLCVTASFAANYLWADIVTFLVFSVVGYFMRLYGWPRPPLLVAVVLGSQLERYLWLSQARYGWEFLTHPGVLIIIFMIVATLIFPAIRNRRKKKSDAASGTQDAVDTPASRIWGSMFTAFMAGVLLLGGIIAMEWGSLRSAMIVYWLVGIGVPLALLDIFFDLRSGLGNRAASLRETLMSPFRSVDAQRTLVMGYWLFGLAAGVVLVGFHLAIAIFIIAYVRLYGGSWKAALCLTAFGEAFLVVAFDYLITVLWPTPVLMWLFT
ncbi:MAG: putative tricarboxylic transport membrane protein [Alphaproteobacteria bacterium]|jgi:putative tricarboxylic transport membrane protein